MELLQLPSTRRTMANLSPAAAALKSPFIFALCDLLSLCKQTQLNSFINTAKDTDLNVPILPTNLDAEQKTSFTLASHYARVIF